ncbi:transposase [Nonomuraea sp. PA05]|uniref:transposase n=1 Tax=Nonomuraea sp. PA05 TaxID=2604466 RepID=UPI0011D4113F|nr:transposase [Nonomuraea sp. PA05]TYB62307.1 transposase [Nonomuraea sp. PA05]
MLPAEQARATAEACLPTGIRARFAIDAAPYPRPDAECSPGRGHVYHDACRCDGTRKTILGWEYQFVAALGEPRSAWTAPVDAARTTHATRLAVTTSQVRTLTNRLHAGDDLPIPLGVLDAGYPATALSGLPAHLVLRLPVKNVSYRDPLTRPGKPGRPGKFGQRIKCIDEPQPEPDEELVLPDTSRCGTVHVACWQGVHPKIHGDRTNFAAWPGGLQGNPRPDRGPTPPLGQATRPGPATHSRTGPPWVSQHPPPARHPSRCSQTQPCRTGTPSRNTLRPSPTPPRPTQARSTSKAQVATETT